MPDISSVNSVSTFLDFLSQFAGALIDSLKFMFKFFVNIFNPAYYTDIFSFLPYPFSIILGSLVSFVCVIVLLKLVSNILGAIILRS